MESHFAEVQLVSTDWLAWFVFALKTETIFRSCQDNIRVGCVDTMRQSQNQCHFADNILKWIFFNENVYNLSRGSLNFVRRGLIKYIPALVQKMACCRSARLVCPPSHHTPHKPCVGRRCQTVSDGWIYQDWINDKLSHVICVYEQQSPWITLWNNEQWIMWLTVCETLSKGIGIKVFMLFVH